MTPKPCPECQFEPSSHGTYDYVPHAPGCSKAMTPLEQFDREEMQELRRILWQIFIDNQFIKSTDSTTNKVEEFKCGVIDMEATIAINGEFDKDSIEESFERFIKSHDARRDAARREELLARMPADLDLQEDGLTMYDIGGRFGYNRAKDEITSIIEDLYGAK